MFEIINISYEDPYKKFLTLFEEACMVQQDSIDAISISSFNPKTREVESRYVNLKYIINNSWIFFTNYNSLKSRNFNSHAQISVLIYWNKIDTQIRIKANIKKSSKDFSDKHFLGRSKYKNALAISSNQSKEIESYEKVIDNYNKTLNDQDLLLKRPKHWGGYSFTPYYFEFWEGHESRVNKREVFNNIDGIWKHSFLQP